jgi:catechol 2,3-dioxygenase-like lactoylglutathione lyase family enzyme
VFERVTLSAGDLEASRGFYDAVLAPLGLGLASGPEGLACAEFTLVQGDGDRVTRGLHLAFVATSRAEVNGFWRAGVDAGYESDGEPGRRPQYTPDYYGGFLLDPDGNSAEAVTFDSPRRRPPLIDHLWIRVADLAATRRFYDAVSPVLGLRTHTRPERFHLSAGERSFALVQGGRVTENLRLSFPVADEAAAAAFLETALDVGCTESDGGVLDPDGTVVDAIPSRRTRS